MLTTITHVAGQQRAPQQPTFEVPPFIEAGVPGLEPVEKVEITQQQPVEEKKSGGFWKKAGLFTAATAVGAGIVGLVTGGGPASTQEVSQVSQSDSLTTDTAPTTITMEETVVRLETDADYQGWQEETISLGKAATTRDFGQLAKFASLGERSESLTNANGASLTIREGVLNVGGREVRPSEEPREAARAFQAEAFENWNVNVQLAPAGQSGNYVSVRVDEQGPISHRDQFLRTYDARTGLQVTLDQVVGGERAGELADYVHGVLMNQPDGEVYLDEAALYDHVMQSFALFEEGGQTKIAVAVPAAMNYAAGSVAEVILPLR